MRVAFSKETYLYWYELMQLIRIFEGKVKQQRDQTRNIRGFLHLYRGQEAVAAGCVTAIRNDDNMITAYRDHGLAIAKGIPAKECMAELFGKATGCTKGKGGSMHFFSKEKRFFGGHGIVGGQIGLGAGIAFAERYVDTDRVTLCLFGDGAARQGMLHEVFNMAMLWMLPVIFICENNLYAMGTSVERTSKVVDIYTMANSYGMPADIVDGMSCEAVHTAVALAVTRARENGGPTFLELKTYRFDGHSATDPANYRTKEELAAFKKKDPITQLLKVIRAKKLASEEEIATIDEKVRMIVEESIEFAEASPYPDEGEVYKDIYSDQSYPFIVD